MEPYMKLKKALWLNCDCSAPLGQSDLVIYWSFFVKLPWAPISRSKLLFSIMINISQHSHALLADTWRWTAQCHLYKLRLKWHRNLGACAGIAQEHRIYLNAIETQKLVLEWHCIDWLLIAESPSDMLAYLRDGSTQTILRAATLR